MGKRVFYQLDLQSSARREAWQRAADRNGVEVSVFVKTVVDLVARFDGGLVPWPGLALSAEALEVGRPLVSEAVLAPRREPPVEVWPEVALASCVHPREARRPDGWRERCRCGVLV